MVEIALPRTARSVAAALALVVLLACAGPAGAGSHATSSATSGVCVTATKKLRAAKARLAKVQRKAKRGLASRAAVARARRAVKKAGAAQRRACAAPANPGGTGGTPAPPPGTPDQPAPPPPPPPPPDDEPTSHDLIQKALDGGRIDSETALRYRVFAEFGDDRLPDEFRGAPLGTDTDSLDEVAQRWDQLSSDTRAALDPFFIPPFNPGSWYDLSSAAAKNAAAGEPATNAATGEQGSNLCENTAPDMSRWGYVTAAGSKVRVWYENTQSGQLDKAIAIAEYLDAGAWDKVTGVFRTPLPDGGDLTGQRCRGFDPAIDIALTPLQDSEGRLVAGGRTVAYYDQPDCQAPASAFVMIARSLTGKTLMANVVHELAHVTHFAYSLKHCRQNVSWLTEATAAWTESYVGGLGPDNPEQFAPYFFDRPNLPLETYEPETATPRHYGSYLFFQWLAKNRGADAVGKIWEDAESGGDPIDTIQQTLTGLGFSGGFEEAWKRFALAGLNPRPEVDWFKQWGLARGAAYDSDSVLASGEGKTYSVSLPHLSAEYHWLTFTSAKAIQVTNELAGVPGASVQLWLRINQGGQDHYEVRDVSGEETTTFCRDLPAENVQEMALVIANSEHVDRIHKLQGKVNVKGRPTCSKWDGTTKTTIKRDGLTEVYLANYTFELQWTRPLDGGGTESYFMAQGSYDMHASWSVSGVSETDGCTYSGGTSWPAGVEGLQAQLDLRDAGQGNPATTYDFGFGLPFKSMLIQRTNCPDGYSGPVYFQLGLGFMSQPHPWDPTDQSIIGSETQDYPGLTIKREWTLSRNGIAP